MSLDLDEAKMGMLDLIGSVGTISTCTLCQGDGLIFEVIFKPVLSFNEEGRWVRRSVVGIKKCEDCYIKQVEPLGDNES